MPPLAVWSTASTVEREAYEYTVRSKAADQDEPAPREGRVVAR